jgi:hypothetical protein
MDISPFNSKAADVSLKIDAIELRGKEWWWFFMAAPFY